MKSRFIQVYDTEKKDYVMVNADRILLVRWSDNEFELDGGKVIHTDFPGIQTVKDTILNFMEEI